MEDLIEKVLIVLVPVAVELSFRLIKSEKKLSIFRLLARLFNLVADALDKVVPDRLKGD